jgi:PfpI family intracellular protease
MSLNDKTIAILTADDGIERVELVEPRHALEHAGARVLHITPSGGHARTFEQTEPTEGVRADAAIDSCAPDQFDALVLPGGYINPDLLRRDERAVAFVRGFAQAGKPIGVICHGPWTLIEADAVRGRTLTSVASLETDIRNAGGDWVDEAVHVDRGPNLLISSRNHDTVGQFAETLVRELGASPAEQHDDDGRATSERSGGEVPEAPPMDPATSEADRTQLDLACAQGEAYGRALEHMAHRVARDGGATEAGHYVVGYAVEDAEGMYEWTDDGLKWRDPDGENLHLEVSVRDRGDGRFVPAVGVTATLTAPDGSVAGPFELPLLWHPMLYHYGRNVTVPTDGDYALRVRIDPPAFMRHDEINGRRFLEPVEVEFDRVQVERGKD